MKIFLGLAALILILTQGTFPALATETGQVRQLQKLQEGMTVDTRFADYFEKLKTSPKDPQLHLALAQVYLEKDLLEFAILSFRRALFLQSSLPQAHYGLSHTYRKKKLKLIELLEMEIAVQGDPENLQYRYELGVLYMEPANFNYGKAKKQYKFLKKRESPLAGKLGTLMQIDS